MTHVLIVATSENCTLATWRGYEASPVERHDLSCALLASLPPFSLACTRRRRLLAPGSRMTSANGKHFLHGTRAKRRHEIDPDPISRALHLVHPYTPLHRSYHSSLASALVCD